MDKTNGQAALEAASRVHQRAGNTKNRYGNDVDGTASASDVIKTANAFYEWLQERSL